MNITQRAEDFAKKYASITSERQYDQNFIRDFVSVFTTRDPADIFRFQYPVKKPNDTTGAIDALWAGHMLIEMKSAGKNLPETLKDQARPYIAYLPGAARPKMTVVSDFQNFLVEDPDGTIHAFPLSDLHQRLGLFAPIFDEVPTYLRHNGTVNEQAAHLLGDVIKGLWRTGYPEADMPTLATRLLFCLYADDNYVWKAGTFHGDVERTPAERLGREIDGIFGLLDKPKADTTDYCYINGQMFSDDIAVATFDNETRGALLRACEYDWRGLDPMIFGTIYQSAMNADERHAEGAHYTHEQDILDVLGPAFLNDLRAQLDAAQGSSSRLRRFLERLADIRVLDPACGSGNFLMVAYREMRALETQAMLDLATGGARTIPGQRVSLSQFHGIEYNGLSAAVARTSLWLTLHAADQRHTDAMGEIMWDTFPLKDVADVRHANAATLDWNAGFPGLTAIVGNPPYVGQGRTHKQSPQQIAERKSLGIKGGNMDYAHIWMIKAAQYIAEFPEARSGYVITAAVALGTQAKGLWSHPAMQDVYPIFGRQSYVWPGDASVRVVNYGLGSKPEALELRAEDRSMIPATYLTPYLTATAVPSREAARASISAPPWMTTLRNGVSYADFGYYSKLGDDLAVIQRDHPEMLINKVSASNLLSGKDDPVLWFGNRTSAAVAHKAIAPRREAVRVQRGAGHPKGPEWVSPTVVLDGEHMVIPRHFSKGYERTPLVTLSGEHYMTDGVYYGPLDWFMVGLVMSKRATDAQRVGGGKLGKGGDIRYNTRILYGMPAPANDTPALREAIAAKARECVGARPGPAAECMKVTNMPEGLARLHRELDALVDEWWG